MLGKNDFFPLVDSGTVLIQVNRQNVDLFGRVAGDGVTIGRVVVVVVVILGEYRTCDGSCGRTESMALLLFTFTLPSQLRRRRPSRRQQRVTNKIHKVGGTSMGSGANIVNTAIDVI